MGAVGQVAKTPKRLKTMALHELINKETLRGAEGQSTDVRGNRTSILTL